MFYDYSGMTRPIVQETIVIERIIAGFPRGEGTGGSPGVSQEAEGQGKMWS